MLSTDNTAMLSRMILKSLASIVPEIVKFVIVDFSDSLNAEERPPALMLMVFETWACKERVRKSKQNKEVKLFISFYYVEFLMLAIIVFNF